MTAMLLDHRLDSARHVHSSMFSCMTSATVVSKSNTFVSMHIALQSYNKIDGIVTSFFRI